MIANNAKNNHHPPAYLGNLESLGVTVEPDCKISKG
jgi:hypothetical protein